MAESNISASSFVTDIQNMLECPLCLSTLVNPIQLPCHHSFCEACIKQLISTSTGKHRETSKSIGCPVCRAPFPADQALVRDFFKQNLIEQLTLSHEVPQSTVQNQVQAKTSQENQFCRKHSTELVVRYCRTCKQLMCVDCVAEKCQNSENGHHEAVNKNVFENELATLLRQWQEKVELSESGTLNLQKSFLGNGSNDISECHATAIKKQIQEHADYVCGLVKQKAAKMAMQIDVRFEIKKSLLGNRVDESLKVMRTVKNEIVHVLESPLEEKVARCDQLEKKIKTLPSPQNLFTQLNEIDVEFIPTQYTEQNFNLGKLQALIRESRSTSAEPENASCKHQ